MSEIDTLREIDSTIMVALQTAGLASQAVHVSASTGAETTITILRDPEVAQDGPANWRREVVTIQLAQVTPSEGDILRVGADQLRLVTQVDGDYSSEQWAVAKVAA
jgi:hypothetical protein